MWDLIVSVPDHCLSFYFQHNIYCKARILQIMCDLRQSVMVANL